MGKKGIRSQKGQSESDWGQPKTKRLTVQLTEEGYEAVKKRAERLDMSITEVFERWGRGFSLDSESEIPKPKRTQIPTVDSILSALPRYSRQHVLRIVKAGLDLLIGAPTPEFKRIGDFVKENQEAVLEMFLDAIDNPQERIQRIIDGDKPTPIELSLLSAALPIDDDELMQQFKKEFPNGSNQGSTSYR
jgi:hypothetical protein